MAEKPARRGLSPFPEVMDLQRSLDRLFGGGYITGGESTTSAWQPSVDIFENDSDIVIKVELPEVNRDDVQVNLDDRTLTIRGERKLEFEDKREGYHRIERSYGQFARSFTVPPNINREGLKASYKDGILRVTLPKAEEAKPRQITVE
ncbi:MAG: Hsp20/alpha crystallin family protein [Blastocatellia bacterium]|jgi:HSP20 family protein|nr:Hsp20/alpha crystallin family protein [Blastocatellia bacterium]